MLTRRIRPVFITHIIHEKTAERDGYPREHDLGLVICFCYPSDKEFMSESGNFSRNAQISTVVLTIPWFWLSLAHSRIERKINSPPIQACSDQKPITYIILTQDDDDPYLNEQAKKIRSEFQTFVNAIGAKHLTVNMSTLARDPWQRPTQAKSSSYPEGISQLNPADRMRRMGPEPSIREKAVLDKLNELSAKIDGPIAFIYAGHGEPCSGGASSNWCIGGYPHLTDEALAGSARAQLMIIDACYSGNAIPYARRRDEVTQLSVISSALSSQTAVASTREGGVLGYVFSQIAKANSETACAFDLDGDGRISERELASLVLISFYGNALAINTSNSNDEVSRQTPQLPASHVGDHCVFQLSPSARARCPSRISNGMTGDRCEDAKKRFLNLSTRLPQLLSDRKLQTLFPSNGLGARWGETSEPERLSQARDEATSYLMNWKSDISKTAQSCGFSDASRCHDAAHSIQSLMHEIDDLALTILNFKGPRSTHIVPKSSVVPGNRNAPRSADVEL